MEDEVGRLKWIANIVPLARSPMEEKAARSLSRYAQKVHRAIDGMAPWATTNKYSDLVRRKKLMDAGYVDPDQERKQRAAAEESKRIWKSMQANAVEREPDN